MKPIFDLDFFEGLPCSEETRGMIPFWDARIIADTANAYLTSLGIDASTPDRLSNFRDMVAHLEAKVAELELLNKELKK